MKSFLILVTVVLLCIAPMQAQVLGPCSSGSETQEQTGTPPPPPKGADLTVNPVPLPGQQAIDFKLPAVVGNDIKEIKLSDYNGKWRVVCFFPAAFTFV